VVRVADPNPSQLTTPPLDRIDEMGEQMLRKLVRNPLVLGIAGLTLVAGCSSSGGASSNAAAGGGASGSSARTITLGLLTSVTGPLSAEFGQVTVKAAQARVALANATHEIPGVTFKLVVQDDQSSPAGALAGTQILIGKDKVFAILDASSQFSAAYKYTAQQKVPVLGWEDGTEFADPANTNLFAYFGSPATDYPAIKNLGQYMKSTGATRLCRVATAEVPAAVKGADQFGASGGTAGINIVYKNDVSFTLTDMSPTALAIKNAGCDAMTTIFPANQQVNLMQALHNLGVNMKMDFGPAYAASDLDPASAAANNGLDFLSQYQPFWMKTAASERVRNALATYAGINTPVDGAPPAGMFWGWFPADLAIAGVKVAGNGSATQAAFIDNLRKVTNYDAGGYVCPVDFTKHNYVLAGTYSSCVYMSQIKDGKFVAPPNLKQPVDLTN
jgi:branched-chain amino acid transport system substrate-binding protein